jgi:hypothetical protein
MSHQSKYVENEMKGETRQKNETLMKMNSTPRSIGKSRPKSYHLSNQSNTHQAHRLYNPSKQTIINSHHQKEKYENRHNVVKSKPRNNNTQSTYIKSKSRHRNQHHEARKPEDRRQDFRRYEDAHHLSKQKHSRHHPMTQKHSRHHPIKQNHSKHHPIKQNHSKHHPIKQNHSRHHSIKQNQNRHNPVNKYNRNDDRKSYRSTTSNYTTTSQYTTDSESFVPPLLSKHQETPRYNIDHEVKQSITPNLNLSTYGYSVNATDTTRQKALFDAVSKEGIDAVRNRIIWLLEKYADKEELVQILSCDFDWLDKYYTSTSLRERFDSQRKQIKQKIYQRMQEKSKSRRRSLKDHYRN